MMKIESTCVDSNNNANSMKYDNMNSTHGLIAITMLIV